LLHNLRIAEAIGKGLELNCASSNPDVKLFAKKLSGQEEVTVSEYGAELQHVMQADFGLFHRTPSLYLFHQTFGEEVVKLLSGHNRVDFEATNQNRHITMTPRGYIY
jgi:hypothetical protein